MIKYFESTGLSKQFDSSTINQVETRSTADSDVVQEAMGKELLASATDYVRIYLLSSLFDGR